MNSIFQMFHVKHLKKTNYSLTMHIIEIKHYVNKGNLLNVMFHVKHLWNPVVKRGIIVKHRKGK